MNKEHNVRTSTPAGWTAFRTVSGRRLGLIGTDSTGHSPRRLTRTEDQRVHQAAKQRGVRTVGGERQSDPGGGFPDSHRHLEQAQPKRRELALGQRVRPGNGTLRRAHQPVGGGVQNQPHLVGQRRAATGPVGGELTGRPTCRSWIGRRRIERHFPRTNPWPHACRSGCHRE
jgi:hypothetical protein